MCKVLGEKRVARLYVQTSFLFFIGRHSPVNSQCPEAVTSFPLNIVNDSTKKLLDADDVTTSRPRKLQNSKNGLQQFGRLIARVFLLEIFYCIYPCFECIKKNYWVRLTHNIRNYPDLGLCYPPQPSALAGKTDLGLENFLISCSASSSNCLLQP